MQAIKEWFEAQPQGTDHDAEGYVPGSEAGSGIFIRELGAIREISQEEWDRRVSEEKG